MFSKILVMFVLSVSAVVFAGQVQPSQPMKLSCVLEHQSIERDGDGDKTFTHVKLSEQEAVLKNGSLSLMGVADDYYFHARLDPDRTISVFLRDKKNMLALETRTDMKNEGQWLLSEPGAETDNGLLLNCKLSK